MGNIKIEDYIEKLYFSRYRSRVFREIKLSDIKFVVDGMHLSYKIVLCYQNGQYGGNYDTFYEYLIKFLTKLKSSIHLIIFKSDNIDIMTKKSRMESYSKNLKPINSDIKSLKSNPGLFNRTIILQAIKDLNISYLETDDMDFLAYYANGFNSTKSFFTVFSMNTKFNIFDLKKGYFSWKYGMGLIKKFEQFDENTFFPIFYLCDFLDFVQLTHQSWIYFNAFYSKFEFKHSKEYEFILNSIRELKVDHSFSNYFSGELQNFDRLVEIFKFEATNFSFKEAEFDEYLRFINSLKEKKQKIMPCLIEDNDQTSVFNTNCIYSIFDEILSVLFEEGKTVELVFRDKNSKFAERRLVTKKLDRLNISVLLEAKDVPGNLRTLLASLCLLEKENSGITMLLRNAIIINMMLIHIKRDKILDLYSSNDYNETDKYLVEKYEEILKKIDQTNFSNTTIKTVHLINKFQAIFYMINVLNKLINPSMNSITVNLVLNGFFVTMYLSNFKIREEIDKIISESKFLFECKNHLLSLLTNVTNNYNNLLIGQLKINE